MATDSQPGPRPGWNGWGLGLAAVGVAAFVILFAPAAPDPTSPEGTVPPTQPTSCAPDDDLCRAVDLLEDLRDDPDLTPQEREALDTLQAGIDDDVRGTTTPPPVTSPPSSTTTSTTTTTQPPRVLPIPDPDDVADGILDDLLDRQSIPTTIPEGAGGVP